MTYRTPKQTSGYIYFHQHTPWCSPDSRPHLTSPRIALRTCAYWSWSSRASVYHHRRCHPRVRRAHPARHIIAAAHYIPCLVCQYLQTSTRTVFSTRSHTILNVFGALAVLSAFTFDASAALLLSGLNANAPQQCIITRPLLDIPPYDTQLSPKPL